MFACVSEPTSRDSRRKREAHSGSSACAALELLERDLAVEVDLARAVDDGHAAAADPVQDLVPLELQGAGHVLPTLIRLTVQRGKTVPRGVTRGTGCL